MTLYGTPLCFLGSHLAAHMQHVGVRDMDVRFFLIRFHVENPFIRLTERPESVGDTVSASGGRNRGPNSTGTAIGRH